MQLYCRFSLKCLRALFNMFEAKTVTCPSDHKEAHSKSFPHETIPQLLIDDRGVSCTCACGR